MKNICILILTGIAALATGCAHQKHAHQHQHGPQCGHLAVLHEGHVDYLDGGHLHSQHGSHADEHRIAISDQNPGQCTPSHSCSSHEQAHAHGPNCGHEAVPHGSHTDYLVGGHLHHAHGSHCDDHGRLALAE